MLFILRWLQKIFSTFLLSLLITSSIEFSNGMNYSLSYTPYFLVPIFVGLPCSITRGCIGLYMKGCKISDDRRHTRFLFIPSALSTPWGKLIFVKGEKKGRREREGGKNCWVKLGKLDRTYLERGEDTYTNCSLLTQTPCKTYII